MGADYGSLLRGLSAAGRLVDFRAQLAQRSRDAVPVEGAALGAYLAARDPSEVIAALRLVCLREPEAFPEGPRLLAELAGQTAAHHPERLRAQLHAQLGGVEPPSAREGRWKLSSRFIEGAVRQQLLRAAEWAEQAFAARGRPEAQRLSGELSALASGPALAPPTAALTRLREILPRVDALAASEPELAPAQELLRTLCFVLDPLLLPRPARQASGAGDWGACQAAARSMGAEVERIAAGPMASLMAPLQLVVERFLGAATPDPGWAQQAALVLRLLPQLLGDRLGLEEAERLGQALSRFIAELEPWVGPGEIDQQLVAQLEAGAVKKPRWPFACAPGASPLIPELRGRAHTSELQALAEGRGHELTWQSLSLLGESAGEKTALLSTGQTELAFRWVRRGQSWSLADRAEIGPSGGERIPLRVGPELASLLMQASLSLGQVRAVQRAKSGEGQNSVFGVELAEGGVAFLRRDRPELYPPGQEISVSRLFAHGAARDHAVWLLAEALGLAVVPPVVRLAAGESAAGEVVGFNPFWSLSGAVSGAPEALLAEMDRTRGCSVVGAASAAGAQALDEIDLLILLSNNFDPSGLNVGLDAAGRPRMLDCENAFMPGADALQLPLYYDRGRTADLVVSATVREKLAGWTRGELRRLLAPSGLPEAAADQVFDRARYALHLLEQHGGRIPRAACTTAGLEAFCRARGEA